MELVAIEDVINHIEVPKRPWTGYPDPRQWSKCRKLLLPLPLYSYNDRQRAHS